MNMLISKVLGGATVLLAGLCLVLYLWGDHNSDKRREAEIRLIGLEAQVTTMSISQKAQATADNRTAELIKVIGERNAKIDQEVTRLQGVVAQRRAIAQLEAIKQPFVAGNDATRFRCDILMRITRTGTGHNLRSCGFEATDPENSGTTDSESGTDVNNHPGGS